MAQGYLRPPPESPLPTPPTDAQVLGEIATQLGRIAHALQKIAYALAIQTQAEPWELRERLGPLYDNGGLQCPPPQKTTKS
jgi:hypothetical protein